jgi:hypothetical protein
MHEFPKWLYRIGEEIEWEGHKLAGLIVADAEAEAKAIADGWRELETLLKQRVEAAVETVKRATKRKA